MTNLNCHEWLHTFSELTPDGGNQSGNLNETKNAKLKIDTHQTVSGYRILFHDLASII